MALFPPYLSRTIVDIIETEKPEKSERLAFRAQNVGMPVWGPPNGGAKWGTPISTPPFRGDPKTGNPSVGLTKPSRMAGHGRDNFDMVQPISDVVTAFFHLGPPKSVGPPFFSDGQDVVQKSLVLGLILRWLYRISTFYTSIYGSSPTKNWESPPL